MPHEHQLKQNHLLAALPPSELKNLKPHLEQVLLRAGEHLVEPGRRSSHSYFPIDSVICIYYRMANGDSAEVSMLGNEGMFSVTHVLGGESMPYLAAIETTGHAFRIECGVLREAFNNTEALRNILLLYSQAVLTQMAQAAVCGKHHSLNQQLCLHLLLMHDKSLSDDFILTHEAIAHMLGVRREGVSNAASKLRDDGLIDYKRGHIKVMDRVGLENQCCECYGVVKKEFLRLLGY